jgi:chemotaxis family two-component system sensor kinase Cph1
MNAKSTQAELNQIYSDYLIDEPIHLCGNIQSHGVLLVLEEPELNILQISNNTAAILGISPTELLGKNIGDFLSKEQTAFLPANLKNIELNCLNFIKMNWRSLDREISFDGIFHRQSQKIIILELEPNQTSNSEADGLHYYQLIKASAKKLQLTVTHQEFCDLLCQEVRKITGFDRVMVYRFDGDWHGCVVAEDKREDLESLLGLYYPDGDTKLGRPTFAQNPVRLIPDINLEPSEIISSHNSVGNSPVDLSCAVLRGVSPCHRDYLRNMGVTSTLIISLIKNQQLWGLISCQHYSPRYLGYEVREACELLGQLVSAELAAKADNEEYEYRVELKNIQVQLIENLSSAEDFDKSLKQNQKNFLDLVGARGAVVCWQEKVTLLGTIPEETELLRLIDWLKNSVDEEVFYTNQLSTIYPEAEKIKEVASGLLSITLSSQWQNYVVWFRPELIQTVNWAGNPQQPTIEVDDAGKVRLCPRNSFEKWKETVRLKSLPWKPDEITAAKDLRTALLKIVLRKTEELAQLAHELKISNADLEQFAYVASHDLQEPLNIVASYVQFLEMRYAEELDQDAKEYIAFAVDGVQHMQRLIDDLLNYSRVGTKGKEFQLTDLEAVFQRAIANLQSRIIESSAVITSDPLPQALGDPTQLVQLFQNLIGNAIKFRGDEPPEIHVGVQQVDDNWLFAIEDNGIGIDPQFSDRIFVIFQRLHTRDEYPGSGMGLAICKKIIERHRGRIWVESQEGQGATFYFTIPVEGV